MGRKLILDSGVLIAIERRTLAFADFRPDDDLSMSVVTATELELGVKLGGAGHRASRERFIAKALELIPVIDYTMEIVPVHAELKAFAIRSGAPRGEQDLIIAATAATTGRLLVTTDKTARFEEMPGVKSMTVNPS